ncbi:MAG: tyrosine--tRNA ligase [Chitinophagaceae bacterium]
MTNLIEELRWRGMIQDIMPGTEEQLLKEMTGGYVGFDPTADSLHIGNLVTILLLVHLQRCGHQPFALVGGATGMIGDPSGKSEERNLLTEEVLQHNLACIQKQLEKFLDFDPSRPNAAEVVNNQDWFRDFSFLRFIREVGKNITVNYMLAKDSVKKRLETEAGMSFTEFSYQLIQGYDFFHLYTQKNCQLQMGGSDQWGNIVTGAELIRKKTGGISFALTCPLITRADGGKFGKTEQGNIWLDEKKTSPYQFYQFWLNVADEDAKKYIRIFTLLEKVEIEALIREHEKAPHLRNLQKILARETTCMVHSKQDYEFALKASEILFGNATQEILQSLNEQQLLTVLEGVPVLEIPASRVQEHPDIISFLAEARVFPSKGEARKMVQSGGVSLNKTKLDQTDLLLHPTHFIHGRYLLVQKGKKSYFLVKTI